MSSPRPTIRCLYDDLADSVTDGRQSNLLKKKNLPDLSLPLHEIAHPLIATTATLFAGATLPGSARLFRSVRDHNWYETSHGERWRGLVRWHPTDQCWLCVAGWHEQESSDDVFRRFTTHCTVAGGTNSSRYLPDEYDRKRLQGEERFRQRKDEDRTFRVTIVTVLLAAVVTTDAEHETTLPDGTTLRVRLNTDTDDKFDDLRLRFWINWKGGRGTQRMDDVQSAVPGIAPDEWCAIPPGPEGQDPGCYVYVEEDWIVRLVNTAAEHGVATLGSNPNLALDPVDGLAHVGPARSVTAGYAEGSLMRSFCGRRFIPRADPERADPCPTCMFIAGVVKNIRPE